MRPLAYFAFFVRVPFFAKLTQSLGLGPHLFKPSSLNISDILAPRLCFLKEALCVLVGLPSSA